MSTPLEECERRDVKGLYREARKGNIQNFTGVNSPYEAPEHPDIEIDTTQRSIEECVDILLEGLKKNL